MIYLIAIRYLMLNFIDCLLYTFKFKRLEYIINCIKFKGFNCKCIVCRCKNNVVVVSFLYFCAKSIPLSSIRLISKKTKSYVSDKSFSNVSSMFSASSITLNPDISFNSNEAHFELMVHHQRLTSSLKYPPLLCVMVYSNLPSFLFLLIQNVRRPLCRKVH